MENITLAVSLGTSNHGDAHLLCTPSKWTSVAAFFLANFFSHAATVKSLPGESAISTLYAMLLSLMFPVSGVFRGLVAIHQRAIFCDTPLKTAAKAGALCVVVRSRSWMPRSGNVIEHAIISPISDREKYSKNIKG